MNPSRSSVWRIACLGAIATLLGACAVGPDFVRPVAPEADRYTREPLPAATVPADGKAQAFSPGAALAADWWRLFKSEDLDAMVRRAIANNPTLQASEASLRQSQDNLRAGYGVFFPKIGAEAAASRERSSPAQQGMGTSGTIYNLVTLSGIISYPLDIFGGERRMVEALRAQTDYQRCATLAAYLTLTANVVDAGIARAAYQAEIQAIEQLLDLEKEELRLAEAQVRAGTSPYSNLLSIRTQVASNQAALAPLRQAASQAEHLLATLQGVVPSQAALPDLAPSGLAVPADLPVSLPSDLVRQRPDILEAEAQLHVASANIGVATAAMFPSFSLSGAYGAAGTSFGRLSAGNARFWSIGPSATVPLFQGGALWYGRKAAVASFQGQEATYRQTVLDAFAQVADALKALEHDAEALQAQVDAKRAAGEALSLLQSNYRAGLVAYPDVLAADVQYHEAMVAYFQAVAQREQDTVALFAALGGGWWNGQHPTGEYEAP